MDHDQILPHLFAGSCPRSPEDIDGLRREAGITAVVNLQSDADFDDWEIDWPELENYYGESGVEVRRVPVQDFNPDALRQNLPRCVAAVDSLMKDGHTVYVHCNAGMNRSPSTVIAYLHWIEGRALEEAVDHVTKCRLCDPYVDVIMLATEDRARARGGD